MTMTTDQVLEKVQEVLVEALGVDDDEVVIEAKLEDDLGAESIDYLDIQFRLEKTFGIKIGENELNAESVVSDPRFVEDGKVTDAGMEELRNRLPHLDLDEFDKNRAVTTLRNAFTVDTIVKFVQAKLSV